MALVHAFGAMLVDVQRQRYHPMYFRYAPMPGPTENQKVIRYRSGGHHTAGFDTLDEAKVKLDELCKAGGWIATGRSYDWDGDDVPAMVTFIGVDEEL